MATPGAGGSEQLDVAVLFVLGHFTGADQLGVAVDLVAAVGLGVIDGLVRPFEGAGGRVTTPDFGEADAHRDPPHLREGIGLGVVAQALEGMGRVGFIGAAHQHHELLAAEAGHMVHRPQLLLSLIHI